MKKLKKMSLKVKMWGIAYLFSIIMIYFVLILVIINTLFKCNYIDCLLNNFFFKMLVLFCSLFVTCMLVPSYIMFVKNDHTYIDYLKKRKIIKEMLLFVFDMNNEDKKIIDLFNQFIKNHNYQKINFKNSSLLNNVQFYEANFGKMPRYRGFKKMIIIFNDDNNASSIKDYIKYDLKIGDYSWQYYINIIEKSYTNDQLYDYLSYITNDNNFNGLLTIQPHYANLNILVDKEGKKIYVAKLKTSGYYNDIFKDSNISNILIDEFNFKLSSIKKIKLNQKNK